MPGRGNHRVRMVSFQDAIILAMVLPGNIAKETRTQFADIIRRYLAAGDHTLITEIQANAQSSSPITQMARESLDIYTKEELARKRRREELEMLMLILDIAERKNKSIENQQQSVISFINTMQLSTPTGSKTRVSSLKPKTASRTSSLASKRQSPTGNLRTIPSTFKT